MWELIAGWGGPSRYIADPRWEVHDSTDPGARFEIRNTETGWMHPVRIPHANIHTVLDLAEAFIEGRETL